MEQQYFWENRLRIPIIEPILDTCRFLPEIFQTIIMLSLYLFFAFLFTWLSFFIKYADLVVFPLIFAIQIFLFSILVHRNYLYRKISKIDKAIEIGILWIMRPKDTHRMTRHIILGLILVFLTSYYHYFYGFGGWLKALIVYMVGGFYFLKGLFYVPALYIKCERETSLLIMSDDSRKDHFKMKVSQLRKIELRANSLSFIPENEKQKLTVSIDSSNKINNFSKKERKRICRFLKGSFPRKEILLIH